MFGGFAPFFFRLPTGVKNDTQAVKKMTGTLTGFQKFADRVLHGLPPFCTRKKCSGLRNVPKNNWHTIDQVGNILHTVKNMTPEGGLDGIYKVQMADG